MIGVALPVLSPAEVAAAADLARAMAKASTLTGGPVTLGPDVVAQLAGALTELQRQVNALREGQAAGGRVDLPFQERARGRRGVAA